MAKAKFIGVYASNRAPSVRNQAAATPQKRFWFAWEDGWGRFRVQLLDAAFQPLDAPRVISANEFKRYFEHQPRILVTPVSQLEVSPPDSADEESGQSSSAAAPQSSQTGRGQAGGMATRRGREAATAERHFSAEQREFEQAAELDRQLRSEFAVALARWRRGDRVTPLKVFENMCKREEGIIPAHKHMFTDFAIDLRKSRLPALATRHYQRAVELAPEDSNAHFNLARIYYETGRLDKAEEHLKTALELTPDFEFATRFLRYVRVQRTRSAVRKAPAKKTSRLFS